MSGVVPSSAGSFDSFGIRLTSLRMTGFMKMTSL